MITQKVYLVYLDDICWYTTSYKSARSRKDMMLFFLGGMFFEKDRLRILILQMHWSLEGSDVYKKDRSIEFYIYFHEMQNKFYCDVFESNIRRSLPTQNLTGQRKYMYGKRRKVLKNLLNKLYLCVETIKSTVGHLNGCRNKTYFCPYPGLILSNYLKVNTRKT